MSYYCVSPPDLLTPVLSLTSSNILAKPKSRCHSRFKSFFPRLLSPQGFKEAGELFISRDLAYCSVPLDFKLFLPGCPGAGSNTSSHATWTQYPHSYGLQDPAEESAGRRSNMEGTEDRGAAVAVCVWNRKMNTREETGQGDNYFHPNFIPTIPNHF